MATCTRIKAIVVTSLAAFAAGIFLTGTAVAQPQTGRPAVKTLVEEPIPEGVDPKVSVINLSIGPGVVAGPHTHAGPIYAYILQGDIENQVDPDPPKIYHPGDFFYEPKMHVHRLLRNLSKTDPAQLLVFQLGDTGKASPAVKTLLEKPLTDITNQVATMLTLGVAPGAVSEAHKHPGPVFAYILKGEIENQVDPDPPKTYHAGDLFYEPSMHVHRLLRNLSKTEPAELLILQVREKGQPLVIGSKE